MSAITPRISDIPKGKNASDYKICNIVDFRGINCAENPLDIKLGEAADMKNLYVNDELSLTTRPRLGYRKTLADFSKILYDDGTILFGLDSNKKYKCLYNENSCSFKDNSFDIDKWSIFKNSKGTYFLTCNKGYFYLDISNYTFKNVIYSEEAYIPTTKIGKSFLDENAGTEYEQRNLLSKKYRESYLFNLQDTVIPNNFKNEKIELKNVFEVKKSSDSYKYSSNFQEDNKIIVTSPSGKYRLELRPNGNMPPQYNISIIDYENQKCIEVTDNNNNDFNNFVATYHTNEYDTSNHSYSTSDIVNLYFLLGINSDNNYVIYAIKTGYLYESEFTYSNSLSLWSFTIDNNGKIKEDVNYIYGKPKEGDDTSKKYGRCNFGKLDLSNNEYHMGLKFFLKDDLSTEIYFYNLYSSLYSASIYVKDVAVLDEGSFKKYSSLFKSYIQDPWTFSYLYKIVDYYNNLFFYRWGSEAYILQKGILTETDNKDTKHFEYTLTDGSFYGVYIPKSYGELKRYEFIDDGVLLIFNTETFYLKINTSCPKNQILNSQSALDGDIFNFKYDENLLKYENSLYGLIINLPDSHIYFLRDNIKKLIYYTNGQYYLSSDITQKSPINDIKLSLDSSQEFLGTEAYFTDKKIVLTSETSENITENNVNYKVITKNFVTITYDPSAYNLLEVERSYNDDVNYSHDFSKITVFDDKYWFYRSDTEPNLIRYSYDTTGLYIPENSYDDIGDSSPITSMMQITDSYLGIFKENSAFTVTEDSETADLYYVQTLKTELGNVPVGQTIVTSYTNNPLVINNYGIYGLGQNKNILETDSVFYSITDKITSKYIKIKNKQNIKTHNHRFYTYFYYSENNITKMWVLDNRFNAWYYWELPLSSIDYIYDTVYDLDNADEVLTYIWSGNKLYMLTTSYYGILGNGNDSNLGASDIIGYQDYLNSEKGAYKRIEWYWKTPPLILQTINFLKKIVDMSMLFADAERETMYDSVHHKLIYGPGTDYRNNLELFYDIKTYRKKSMLLNSSYKGHIDYVSNARVKPRCQKCDFASLTLYNKITKDGDNVTYTYDNSNSDSDGYNNGYDIIDKLNLIGLTFKVVLS